MLSIDPMLGSLRVTEPERGVFHREKLFFHQWLVDARDVVRLHILGLTSPGSGNLSRIITRIDALKVFLMAPALSSLSVHLWAVSEPFTPNDWINIDKRKEDGSAFPKNGRRAMG